MRGALQARGRAVQLFLALALMVGAALAVQPATAGRDDSWPRFEVLSKDGDFEVRLYAPHVIASYTKRATYKRAVNEGYIRLERYFTGENSGPEPMPIAPPIMVRDDGAEGWTTILVLPPEYRVETAPRPNDQRVRVVELPERRVAAVRFKGKLGERVMREQVARLKAWLEARGLAHRGDFTMASYDPPWKISSLRRAAILVTLR